MQESKTPGLTLTASAIHELEHCNKCGFCLPACPTYQETGSEVHSPRGRLSLVEAAWRGEIEPGPHLAESLSLCLGCRACETACPSGVLYGRVLEEARADLYARSRRFTVKSPLVSVLLKAVRRRSMLKGLVGLGRWARRVPLGAGLARATAMLPPERLPLAARGGQGSRSREDVGGGGQPIWFFTTCVMDAVYERANQAAVALLTAAGAQVTVVRRQECCGALHLHTGDIEAARDLARKNLSAWRTLPEDAWIVSQSGGCGAMLGSYGHLLDDDREWGEMAETRGAQVRDFATALEALPYRPVLQGRAERVSFQNSCHLVNGLQHGEEPKRWLAAVPGDFFVPLPSQDRCCGSAGVYNLNEPEMASQILHRHVAELRDAEAAVWVVANPGCGLQCQAGVGEARLPVRVEQLAEYLYDRWTGEVVPRASGFTS